MARDPTHTQFDFNTGPADPAPFRGEDPRSTDESRPVVPTKDVAVELKKKKKKRKRPVEDEGRNNAKSRFPKLLTSRFPNPRAPEAYGEHHIRETNIATAQALPGGEALDGPSDLASTRKPLTVKDESPWKIYSKEYQIELGGFVTVAERK